MDIYQKGAVVKMYFSAAVMPNLRRGAFCGEEVFAGERSRTGVGAGVYLRFDTRARRDVGVKIGLSYTSVENARLNMQAEAADLDFDGGALGRKRSMGRGARTHPRRGRQTEDRVKILYGAVPCRAGTRSGQRRERGLSQRTTEPSGRFRSTPPATRCITTIIPMLWGGFWNLTQLWSIAYPEYYADWISSQLLVYKDAGWLGDGIACSKYVSGVGTNFTGLAIAAAYNCGIRNFDVALGYEAARKNELGSEGRPAGAGKLDVGQFVERGYSPYSTELHMQTTPRGSGFSASHTLEYSFSAYAVAQMARQLGHEADYERLSKLSEGWKLLFDPETKLMRPRDEQGRFIADFDPYAPWVGFQEGNAVQYTYYVPHDIDRLVEMVGREEFNNRLDSTFLISRENIFGGGKTIDAFAGLYKPTTNHGNQPNLHISGLFNFFRKPWLSEVDAHDLQRILRYGGDSRLRLRTGRGSGTARRMVRHGFDGTLRREGPDGSRSVVPALQPAVRQDYDQPESRLLRRPRIRDRDRGQRPENYYIGSAQLDGNP